MVIACRFKRVDEMRILVAGGFESDRQRSDDIRKFCQAMGKAVAVHGHILLNGARTELDALMAEAAEEALQGSSKKDRDQRIVSYVLSGHEPVHTCGTLISVALNWEIGSENFYVPEQVAPSASLSSSGDLRGRIGQQTGLKSQGSPCCRSPLSVAPPPKYTSENSKSSTRSIALGSVDLSSSSSTASRIGLLTRPTSLL